MKNKNLIIGSIICILIVIIIITVILVNILRNNNNGDISELQNNIAQTEDVSEEKSDFIDVELAQTEESEEKRLEINLAVDLYDIYIQNIFDDQKEIYNHLEQEYKQTRFPTEKSLNDFLEKIKDYVSASKLSRYKKIDKEGDTEYVFVDSNDMYVYINEKSITDYTLILDNHTLDTDEFIEKYNNATTEQKVRMNAEKILDAINTFDYEYLYSKLDESFKKKNFDTLEKFEKYAEENLYSGFSIADVEAAEYSIDENKYTLTMGADYISFTMEIKLLENRDFVMVFKTEIYSPEGE